MDHLENCTKGSCRSACGCAIIWVSDTEETLPNKHLEHPEDNLFNGVDPYEVLDSLINFEYASTKWDGAPAIVFGHNEGKWFVGTKSVFNKKKVLINYSPADIARNHNGPVAQLLTACFYALPRVEGIYQGDFIGFGGRDIYKANTIEYKFPDVISEDVIVAPHTKYREISPDAIAEPASYVSMTSTHHKQKTYRFLETNAKVSIPKRVKILSRAAKLLIPFCKFPKDGAIYKQHVNKFVRNGVLPRASVIYDALPDKYKCEVNVMTFRLYNIILKLKDILLTSATADEDVECYINGELSSHEGFVLHGKHSVKLVNRLEFSQANFNLNKNWKNEKV